MLNGTLVEMWLREAMVTVGSSLSAEPATQGRTMMRNYLKDLGYGEHHRKLQRQVTAMDQVMQDAELLFKSRLHTLTTDPGYELAWRDQRQQYEHLDEALQRIAFTLAAHDAIINVAVLELDTLMDHPEWKTDFDIEKTIGFS